MPKTKTDTPPFPPITLVEDDWLADFDDFDGSEAEKRELINALWTMMLTCVDICRSLPSPKETSGQPVQLTNLLHRAVLHSEEANLRSSGAVNGRAKNTRENV